MRKSLGSQRGLKTLGLLQKHLVQVVNLKSFVYGGQKRGVTNSALGKEIVLPFWRDYLKNVKGK